MALDSIGKVTPRASRARVLDSGSIASPSATRSISRCGNELCAAYGELERDPDLRVGVLFAHGEHFTGGLDLPQWGATFASGAWHIAEGGIDPLGLTSPRE